MLQREWSDSMRWINKKSIIWRRLAAEVMITIRWACTQTETCASGRRAFYRRQTIQRQDVDDQMLRKEPLTITPSISVSTNWAAAAIFPVATSEQARLIAEKPHFDTLVLSDFRELKSLCCQTSNRNSIKDAFAAQSICATALPSNKASPQYLACTDEPISGLGDATGVTE